MRRFLCLVWAIGVCLLPRDLAAAEAASSLSPTERMKRERLAATHAAVQDLQKQRRERPPTRPGLTDFRCIFHAHAEDSAHTGGTLPEMLADAKKAGVHAIFLSNHHRPPRDFMDAWRGLREGVLFVPGSEARGFLVHPVTSILPHMDLPATNLIPEVTAGEGLIFLSHIEDRPDHPMDGLHGLEIYNRHFDAKRDRVGLLALATKLTHPKELAELQELVALYPDEILSAQVQRQDAYLEKWDSETATGRRLTGVGANDCHHNQVLLVKVVDEGTVRVGTIVDKDEDMRQVGALTRPGVLQLTRGRQPGDIVARLDLDPYFRSFRNLSTHVFAPELTEAALRAALKAGRAYVSHDWLCDATGFSFEIEGGGFMGDEVKFRPGLSLHMRTPAPCRLRLLRGGVEVAAAEAGELRHEVKEPGVYRVEAAFVLAGDLRPWIYSNPIYVR